MKANRRRTKKKAAENIYISQEHFPRFPILYSPKQGDLSMELPDGPDELDY